ncbi:acyl-[acyl-carrier-protein]--UDP-N-acetylglucosam ine O-acyltransferase [Longispora fulva]|uniref:UDP-N-acetylglucosamine acyltransferase n=1 Tax=Longispora fulva TaxID=619741 RepID=A0A8J7KXM6_9ACTN|nr:UDP-N-acetylglucosamine acyltransferase [Longispora fulva]MBG6138062.1 UDP-N-acetylglucosamine acyltransferase [Longispora fulva]GIG60315.1 acyl-[acyl-carrier-protein]--UDP-N-acetylglucosam ine O-acyltransferase [Longispora fulva]
MANRIHSSAIIGDGVELGDGNVIGPYTVIVGPTRIGDGNWIGPMVSIGTPAEYRAGNHPVGWEGELDGAGVAIGDGNIIRDFVTVNQGVHVTTTVADGCYLLARSHVGHDCVVDDGVTLSDNVQLGGHTHVWSWSNIGMGTVVHQYGQIGPGAMIGMGSAIRKDIGPFMTAVGNPAREVAVNRVGLTRRGCDEGQADAVEEYLKKRGDLPAGLPEELAARFAAWEGRGA